MTRSWGEPPFSEEDAHLVPAQNLSKLLPSVPTVCTPFGWLLFLGGVLMDECLHPQGFSLAPLTEGPCG